MRRDCWYDGKLLNIGERFVLDGVDVQIFCYIFVYSRRRTDRRNRRHAVDWIGSPTWARTRDLRI